jgi:phage tail sheath protein FI
MPTDPSVSIAVTPGAPPAITGVATSIAAFAGWAPKGPTDRAELVLSLADYTSKFGGFHQQSYLSYAVPHFFVNGGQRAYIVRLATGDSSADVLMPNNAAFEAALLPANGVGGVFHLDQVNLFNLLCVPGQSNPSVLASLQKFCSDRRAFLIADCASDASLSSLQNGPDSGLRDEDAINAAYYFPWVLAPDPLQANAARAFPPSGFAAGIYARTDSQQGVWKAPAGTTARLVGASGLNAALNDADIDALNAKAVDCVRNFPSVGTVLWGERTLQGGGHPEWQFVPVRRLALFIEQSLDRGLKWTAFEPNAELLWSRIRSSVDAFLSGLFRRGAFQGQTPDQAFFVRCDNSTTTQNDIDRGVVNIVVGFAPIRPAEFVILTLQQLVGQSQ